MGDAGLCRDSSPKDPFETTVKFPRKLFTLRAAATDFDVTVAVRTRAQENRESSVPRRETVLREARPKIFGESSVPRSGKVPREARPIILRRVRYNHVPREVRENFEEASIPRIRFN